MKRKIIIYSYLIIITLISSILLSMLYFEKTSKKFNKNNSINNNVLSKEENKVKEEKKEDKKEQNKNEKDKNNFSIKLSFAGDTMLANLNDYTSPGSFNDYASREEPTYFLEKVSHIFLEDDFTILNLENVLSDRDLSPVAKNSNPAYWYKSKASNINILSSSSIEGVSVSNNHTRDYGDAGKQDTIDAIVGANIEYGDYNHIMYFEKNNFTVAVICKGLWIESQANEIIKLIKEAEEKSDYQIVFFHGGTERIHHPEEWKKRATRKLIDNGADLVVGSHPHVLQPREVYNEKEIVYSLGNFCYGGNRGPENRTIIYQMNLTIYNKTKTLKKEETNIIPCYVYTGKTNNYQPAPIEDENIKNRVLEFMNWEVNSPL